MRLANYYDVDERPLPGQIRAGAHTDYGSLTVLLPDPEQPGLEIKLPNGQWLPVTVPSGSFVINIGDLMARWTNDRWVSTLHRVVNPPAETLTSSRRQSIVFFQQPNWDAEIACIETCLGRNERPSYGPIESGAHLMQKFGNTVIE